MRYSGMRLTSVLPTCVIGEDEEEGEQKRSILCTNSLILKVNLTRFHLALRELDFSGFSLKVFYAPTHWTGMQS